MKENNKSAPLMFIQSIFCEGVNANNQSYYDSRYQVKKDKTLVISSEKNDIMNKIKLIEKAQQNGFEVTSEVVFKSGETSFGIIKSFNEDGFTLDDNLINYDAVVEINIQTIKTLK